MLVTTAQNTVLTAIKAHMKAPAAVALATHTVGVALVVGVIAVQWWLGKKDAKELAAAHRAQDDCTEV